MCKRITIHYFCEKGKEIRFSQKNSKKCSLSQRCHLIYVSVADESTLKNEEMGKSAEGTRVRALSEISRCNGLLSTNARDDSCYLYLV